MDYRDVHTVGRNLVLEGLRNFSLEDILDCGQSFRWKRLGPGSYRGIAFGRALTVSQNLDSLTLHGTSAEDFQRIWRRYFDLERDYGDVKAAFKGDPAMEAAIAFAPGMRVLRQEPWEALCSFILSANNNVGRIKGIVERLCGLLGAPVGEGEFAFPPPERVAALEEADLAPLRCGYRAGYILDAARKVASGELELEPLRELPLGEARAKLRSVRGVGPKVAECVLLYGLGRCECVPVDVWIGRALESFYPDGMPEKAASVAGLGQQYLFHYVRSCPEALQTPRRLSESVR